MDLLEWRTSRKLILTDAAPLFGMTVGGLSKLERGLIQTSYETQARIQGATGGLVTPVDLSAKWREMNRDTFKAYRAAGRSAAAAYRKAARAKPRKRGPNGRKD